MNQEQEHLKLLSIFHYVVAGCAAFFALFPLIYVILGLCMALAPEEFAGSRQPPPALIGWFLFMFGAVMMAVGWAFAALVFMAGRFIAHRKFRTFCIVVACIECLFMPFGTVLGIFSILVLMREPVSELFKPERLPPVS
jgi:hypothetical protein